MKELWEHSSIRCVNQGIRYSDQFSRSGEHSRQEWENQKLADRSVRPHTNKKASRPTVPCDGPRMNPSVDVGNPPRPFRHLRMAERRSPDPSSSRVPVHSALVQKSVTVITNPAGRLSIWMLGKSGVLGKWKCVKSWQAGCYQSNAGFTTGTCQAAGRKSRKFLTTVPMLQFNESGDPLILFL
jgi:hypothetical protein